MNSYPFLSEDGRTPYVTQGNGTRRRIDEQSWRENGEVVFIARSCKSAKKQAKRLRHREMNNRGLR